MPTKQTVYAGAPTNRPAQYEDSHSAKCEDLLALAPLQRRITSVFEC